MRFIFLGIFVYCCVLFSCSSPDKNNKSTLIAPQLTLVDSLVIDYLGTLHLVGIKPDGSEYLLYGNQSKEFVRVNRGGEVRQIKNLKADGSNRYNADGFQSLQYVENGDIYIETMFKLYQFDSTLNLKNEYTLPFQSTVTNITGSNSTKISMGKLITSSWNPDSLKFHRDNAGNRTYPYLTVYDLKDKAVFKRESFPESSQYQIIPGSYRRLDPHFQFKDSFLYVLYPISPEMYRYSFPDLKIIDHIPLIPDESYKQVLPTTKGGRFTTYDIEFIASAYEGFIFSEDYLITWYLAALPESETNFSIETTSNEERKALQEKYKYPIYQIFKGKEKLFEGKLGVQISNINGVIFSKQKSGDDNETEKDYEVFYFYEFI